MVYRGREPAFGPAGAGTRPEPKAQAEAPKQTGPPPEGGPTIASSAGPEGRPGEGPRAAAAATSQVFLELVATLAQQAELLMVGGQGLPRQPEQARRLIDYLGILEAKTRGNLSAEESQILSNVVFQLRSLFLQAGR